MGADGGFVNAADGAVLAVEGLSPDEALTIGQRLAAVKDEQVLSLGGNPPRNAVLVPLAGSEARIVLIGGPFTPVFGADDLGWIRQYAALVRTGMDRVKLVEDVERANGALHEKVAEVTERTHQLEAANRELEAFSYTISHDLRAPLRAINGFTSILLEEHLDALSEEARGYLRRVHENGQHMGRLVDDLLAFSRLGRQALRKQTVDMEGVVERALAQLAPQLENRDIDLVVGDLPGCEADPNLLEQVFVNLLSNAIKYSQKRERPRIEVGVLEQSADSPTYFVRDNGAGFDMAYADKLFGVFQRLHRSQDYEGTGVGLAIVHRIIDRHGGRVWAEAAVDRGATFYFTLKGVQQWQLPKAA
jgi:light-regulated signal transduction histidine kinase (bacteriophytochrome)